MQEKKSSKYINYFIVAGCFIFMSIIAIFIMGIIATATKENQMGDTESVSSVADGFTIEEYKTILDVKKDGAIDVKEIITVDFYEGGHHGIYRTIPQWLKYTNKNGETQSKKAKIKSLVANNEKYTVDIVNGRKRIKIGSANITLPTGLHTYEISYTYNLGEDSYENFDELIFHAFGDYWGTSINNASLEIRMPNKVDFNNKIHFFNDKYRGKDITSKVNYYIFGNTIYANLNPEYNLNKSLTLDIELPEGYFEKGNSSYGYISLTICLLCIASAIGVFSLWLKEGKNLPKVPETVEFYPPDNLDAAQIGYINNGDMGSKLTVALIVELASKGLIKITESEDKKDHIIEKTVALDFGEEIKREVKIIKKKEYTGKRSDKKEIINKYFPDDNKECIITEKFEDYDNEIEYFIKKGIVEVEYDTIEKYSDEEIEKLQDSVWEKEFANKGNITENEKIVYKQLFRESGKTVLSKDKSFYKVFDEISTNLRNTFDDIINDIRSVKSMCISSVISLICIMMWGCAYMIIEDLNPKYNDLYTIAFICNISIIIFSIFMARRTQYGETIRAKIRGFKRYLELAEKQQIDSLVEENPNYFYDILPYAYVLGVSKKWIEKFEDIPQPENDMGNFDYLNISAIDSIASSIYVPSQSTSSSSGGCSSCGGGCSSCGGGGSW